MKKIGIIGGAGPMAGALLFKKIILEYQKKYKCKNDADFPAITLESVPFSPMLLIEDSIKNRSIIRGEIQTAINTLRKTGTEIIAIACNTLHSFLKDIDFKEESFLFKNMIFLNMIKETILYLQERNINNIFILGTATTINSKIYEQPFIKVKYPSPKNQLKVAAIIDRILEGNINESDAKSIKEIIQGTSILGCTELSLLNEYYFIGKNIIDPLDILAKSIVQANKKT